LARLKFEKELSELLVQSQALEAALLDILR
jgi:hypothetical protein